MAISRSSSLTESLIQREATFIWKHIFRQSSSIAVGIGHQLQSDRMSIWFRDGNRYAEYGLKAGDLELSLDDFGEKIIQPTLSILSNYEAPIGA